MARKTMQAVANDFIAKHDKADARKIYDALHEINALMRTLAFTRTETIIINNNIIEVSKHLSNIDPKEEHEFHDVLTYILNELQLVMRYIGKAHENLGKLI